MMRGLPVLFVAAAGLACGSQQSEMDAAPMPMVRGTVSVEGSAPAEAVVVTTADGHRIGIVGALRLTVASLSGAEVTVSGNAGSGAVPGTERVVDATDYDVVAVNGVPASMGVLERTEGGFVLAGRARWTLTAVPSALAARAGRTVWVAGERADGSIRVQLWGVIRTPDE